MLVYPYLEMKQWQYTVEGMYTHSKCKELNESSTKILDVFWYFGEQTMPHFYVWKDNKRKLRAPFHLSSSHVKFRKVKNDNMLVSPDFHY